MDRLVDGVSANGLAYTSRGDGAALLLLHGWCLSGRMWMVQEEALAASRRVICPDLAGFGRSCGLAGPYDLARHATDIGDLIEELDLQDVTVGGFAFGGAVALELAATRPERIDRLVLIGVPSGSTAPYERMPRSMRRDWPDFAQRSAAAICKQPQSDAMLRWLADMFRATPLPVALETVRVLEQFEPAPLAARVRVASTFVHGADDDVVPVAVSEACAAAMPDARVVVAPDSGHFVVLDQPAVVTDALAAAAA